MGGEHGDNTQDSSLDDCKNGFTKIYQDDKYRGRSSSEKRTNNEFVLGYLNSVGCEEIQVQESNWELFPGV